jgi:hypothetical protein
MKLFYNNNIFKNNFFFVLIISLFSFFINFYYSKFGAFPIDTFLHYDSAFRILNNEYPVRDYWIVSGFIVDFIQSIFFKLFGVNWFAYIFHSSLFNLIISIFTYYFCLSLKINRLNSFIYTLSFATLAYTISGTPFVDHHASFFLLISTYLIIHALNFPKKNYLWVFIVILFFFSFLSKQVPFAYVVISQSIILLYLFIKNKNFDIIKIILTSITILILLFLFFLNYLNINFNDFYHQYIAYPLNIGTNRYGSLNNSIESLFNQYKFLILPITIISIIKLKKIKNKELNFSSTEFINFLIILALCSSLIFHQISTRNQIYIYFLIPICFALLETNIKDSNVKLKKYFSFSIIIFVLFITLKYHFRYNETRKFHELENVNLKDAVLASKIDKSLNGLFWINPIYNDEPKKETIILNEAKIRLEKIENNIMFFTNYLFLDTITKKKMNNPNKHFTLDGISFPMKGNKLYHYYENFLRNQIKSKNIKKIYFFKHEKISYKIITKYFSINCYNFTEEDLFYVYEIKCLN